jgi:hypothetical protein
MLALWGRFETPFVHGDPHPANILVLPGSRLCMLDFGACSVISRRSTVINKHLVGHMVNDRVSEMVVAVLQDLSPLPNFDRDAFRRDMEQQFWRYQLGLRDPKAAWFERTSASLWVYLMEVTQRYMLPVNLDTLRMVRATLLYDTLAFRLNPDISLKDTERFLRQSMTRYARRRLKRARQQRPGGPLGLGGALRGARQLADRARLLSDRAAGLQEGALPAMRALAGKASLLAGALLRAGALLVAAAAAAELWGGHDLLVSLLRPAPLLGLTLALSLGGLRLRHRLMDVDPRP